MGEGLRGGGERNVWAPGGGGADRQDVGRGARPRALLLICSCFPKPPRVATFTSTQSSCEGFEGLLVLGPAQPPGASSRTRVASPRDRQKLGELASATRLPDFGAAASATGEPAGPPPSLPPSRPRRGEGRGGGRERDQNLQVCEGMRGR